VPTLELAKAIIRKVTKAKGVPFWFYNDESLIRQFLLTNTEEQIKKYAKFQLSMMKQTSCYMGLRGSNNPFDLNDVPSEKIKMFNKLFYHPVHLEQRVKKTKWVVLRFPNDAMAQLAQQSQEEFEKFYYDVCCIDYPKMSKAMDPLVKLMEATDRVHLKGPGETDLKFSIKGIGVEKCDGGRNIPDGEVYTAPVRNSINGVIQYNTPSLYEGTVFEGIRYEFRDGKIVKATAKNDTAKLNRILDTDPGARYIGEWSIGCNPMILHPMKDTLFDEKIDGSIHLTPGQCYDEAPNGNKSAIHWDTVMIQRKDYGGGEIWFDDKLIRKDGVFVHKDLKGKFTKKALGG
jgi:aminopeptidase